MDQIQYNIQEQEQEQNNIELIFKQKYNNFINILDNQEQCDKENICICSFSSDLVSSFVESNKSNRSNGSNETNKSDGSNELKNLDNYDNLNKFDGVANNDENLSLMDENKLIKLDQFKQFNQSEQSNQYIEVSEFDQSIKTEFKYIFENDDFIQNSVHMEKSKKKLDLTFNKIMEKRQKNNVKKNKEINDGYTLIINQMSNDLIFKLASKFIEKKIFEESTRGWNYDNSIYILNFNYLKANLEKIKINIDKPNLHVKIGYFYRDYTEPRIYTDINFSKYWVNYETNTNAIKIKKLNPNEKILYYGLKNLLVNKKFKKKIGSTNYKFIKKSVQVQGNKDLIIDIIFYVGIKNII